MPLHLNHSGVVYARSLIGKGKISEGAWDESRVQRKPSLSHCFLAVDDAYQPRDQRHWKYPVVDSSGASRPALMFALARATSDGAEDVAKAAKELSALVTTKVAASDPPFYLLSAGATEEATDTDALPKERNGFKCHYYWRQAAQDGTWTNAEKKFTIGITPNLRDQWLSAFNDREKDGDETPIVLDHKEGAVNTLGYVKAVKQDGPWYCELHQYLGDSARDVALKNHISVGVKPNYLSPTGKKYTSAIQHSAITSRPTVLGQGEAHPLLLSRVEDSPEIAPPVESAVGSEIPKADSTKTQEANMADSTMLPCSSATLDALHKHVPGLKNAPPEDKMSRIAQHLQTMRDSVKTLGVDGDDDMPTMLGRVFEKLTTAETKATAAEAKALEAETKANKADAKIIELSRVMDDPKLPDAPTLTLLSRAADTEWGATIATGGVLEPIVKKIKALFRDKDGRPGLLALSRTESSEEPLEFQLATILRENKPLDMSQRSGLQTLSRVKPNDEQEKEDDKAPLPYVEMAARVDGAAK